MVTNAQSVFSQELEDLRRAYLDALPQKLLVVQRTWQGLDIARWDAKAYQSVYRLVHNLTGGTGTFGLTNISTHARSLLSAMKPWLDSELPVSEGDRQLIARAIDLLMETTTITLRGGLHPSSYLRKPPARWQDTGMAEEEVFLIEDDPAQAEFLSLMLENAGYPVRVFHSLKDAQIVLPAVVPSAVLIDMVFPEGELAGAGVIAEIQGERRLEVPIVFLSTRSDLEARLSAVRAGSWNYMTKPIDVHRLVQFLDRTVRKDVQVETKRILMVDDDVAVAAFFAEHLNQEGHMEATLLSEPERLLDALEETQPDLVIMDQHMPGYSGLELAAVIRQHREFSQIPIIFLSEEADLDVQLTAMNIGSDDFLQKSMGPDRLVVAVESRLSRLDQLIGEA